MTLSKFITHNSSVVGYASFNDDLFKHCALKNNNNNNNNNVPSYLCLVQIIGDISLRPLCSLNRHDLFVPQASTSMAQTQAFAIIDPSLLNQLLPSTRSTLLTGEPSASFRSLKTALFSLGLTHWRCF